MIINAQHKKFQHCNTDNFYYALTTKQNILRNTFIVDLLNVLCYICSHIFRKNMFISIFARVIFYWVKLTIL